MAASNTKIPKLLEIPTVDLINELMSRCSPAIFAGAKSEGEEGNATFFEYQGDPAFCYGLCEYLKFTINSDENKTNLMEQFNDE